MPLIAGAARRDITPTSPLFLVGYPHVARTSTGVHDPLLATALSLSDGKTAIILVALDILFIARTTADECRAAIGKATGVPAGNIQISATHTHSGPVTAPMLAWENDPYVPSADPAYMDLFCRGIVEAAVEAHASAVPAEAAYTTARAQGVGGNRHSADGVADPEVGLILVRRQSDRRPLAVDLVYAMHPTVMHEDSTLVSSDFPHYARLLIEEQLPGALVLYHNGPCGNLSPRYHVSGQTFAEAERLGRRLGACVADALRAVPADAFRGDPVIRAARKYVDLPGRKLPPLVETEAHLARARLRYDDLRRQGAPHGEVRTAECAVFGAEEAVLLSRAQASGELDRWRGHFTPAEVQVLRVGDSFLAGISGELFVEYALKIKQASPCTSVISLANGELQGYIVTPEAEAAGGYEAAFAVFPPVAGVRMTDAALKLIASLR